MPELPDRPDLHQLRRQARELLRAARAGDPPAVARLRAVCDRMTLSAAQLALAREHGRPSWPALKAEVERRRSADEADPDGSSRGGDAAGVRWSFDGADPLELAEGVLSCEALVVGRDHAALDATLEYAPGAAGGRGWDSTPALGDAVLVDDRGRRYALSVWSVSGPHGQAGQPVTARLRLGVEPVPRRAVRWLDLRNGTGSATRFTPAARARARMGEVTPVAMGQDEQRLFDQALDLIGYRLGALGAVPPESLPRRCAALLAQATRVRESGGPEAAGELPEQVARLCRALAEGGRADGLPHGWSRMLDAADAADGVRRRVDIGVVLPAVDGVTVRVDNLTSLPQGWRLRLRATPGWWRYSDDGRRKYAACAVRARDDLGGGYVSTFDGSTVDRGRAEDLALWLVPRLDPLARQLRLIFRGSDAEVSVALELGPGLRRPS